MTTRNIVNAKELLVKSHGHFLEWNGARGCYEVTSGTSGKTYEVYPVDDGFVCFCPWGTKGGTGLRERSGCSHAQAAAAYEAKGQGRRLSAWTDLDDAKRQHRPIRDLGNGVVLTSRKVGKPTATILNNPLRDGVEKEI